MKYQRLSTRQNLAMTWRNRPGFEVYDGIICDGSIRSGKTVAMTVGFIMWAMTRFDGCNFAICGKTIESLRRNVTSNLPVWLAGVFSFKEHRTENKIVVSANGKSNSFYLFGGKDESSAALIQGITLAGILLDEVALMPESFVNQATARCSVEGAKLWFNCNPEGPSHWFYTKWVLEASRRKMLHLHFTMDDNLSLSASVKARYESLYVYTNKTASEVIKMVAEDFQLNVGELEDTGYKIASRVEDNQTLFDIIQNALDETLKATGQMYVLYDNVGKLTLKSLGNMKLNMLVDEDTAGDYDYKSSIATQTYDKIKLSYENKETGKREIYIAQDGSHINQWGVLQYYEKLDSKANAKAMADALLDLYNTKTRTLKLQDVLGDIRVRAGTLLVVMLGLGDINVSNYLMAEQVKHTFNDGQHLMELKMRGGTFVT